MRLPIWLNGWCALGIACAAPEQSVEELGVLSQALTETFSGTVAQGEAVARGPLAVRPGSQLRVVLSGTGDADLYVRFGSRPTLSSYDCRPYEEDSSEECVLTVPSNATAVFIDVHGYTAATYSLSIERDDGATGGTGGTGGAGGGSSSGTPIIETFSSTLAQNAAASHGPLEVQPGSLFRAVLSGTGDADLYVRFGSQPTLTSYECRPYEEDSSEECLLTVPSNATAAFIHVHGYRASSYSLQVERVAGGDGGSGGSGPGSNGSGGSGGSGPGAAPFVIAVVGSSTAEGEGASSISSSWVGLLENALSAVADASIINLATGGYTTLELLPGSGAGGSIDAALAEQPDLLIVALAGSNDLAIGTSTDDYLSHLTLLRDTAQAAGVPTFFVGTTPKDLSDEERFLLADWTDQMRTRFSTCWVPASDTYSPCFIDAFAALANEDLGMQPQYVAEDGFHHNDAGHQVIFEHAADVVEPYVCTVTECL